LASDYGLAYGLLGFDPAKFEGLLTDYRVEDMAKTKPALMERFLSDLKRDEDEQFGRPGANPSTANMHAKEYALKRARVLRILGRNAAAVLVEASAKEYEAAERAAIRGVMAAERAGSSTRSPTTTPSEPPQQSVAVGAMEAIAQGVLQGQQQAQEQEARQEIRRQAERERTERENDRYRQMRAEEDRQWSEQNQRMQQATRDRQRAEQDSERQRREQASSQQQQIQTAEYQRQQDAVRRQQEAQRRSDDETRRQRELAEASVPNVESFFRNNIYYVRNNGSRRVMCQVGGMFAATGIGAQPGLQYAQKALVVYPNSEQAPFEGPVGDPRVFDCRAM
jgi:hypothetical protein